MKKICGNPEEEAVFQRGSVRWDSQNWVLRKHSKYYHLFSLCTELCQALHTNHLTEISHLPFEVCVIPIPQLRPLRCNQGKWLAQGYSLWQALSALWLTTSPSHSLSQANPSFLCCRTVLGLSTGKVRRTGESWYTTSHPLGWQY